MAARMWKQILLAVCIIACLFNITSKLVNRHSLRANLESVNDGTTVFNFFTLKEKESADGTTAINDSGVTTDNENQNEQVIEDEENQNYSNGSQKEKGEVEIRDLNIPIDSEPDELINELEGPDIRYEDVLKNFFKF